MAALLARYASGRIVLTHGANQLELAVTCQVLQDEERRQIAEEFANGATW